MKRKVMTTAEILMKMGDIIRDITIITIQVEFCFVKYGNDY